MINTENIKNIKIKDITDINMKNVFLHYTNILNLSGIDKNGLKPRVGINSKVIEKNKKVFFSVGDEGALLIMDIWLKWLIIKPKSNLIYWLGGYLLNVPFFPKKIHSIIISANMKNQRKYLWAYQKLKDILDNSIYLVLDLKEQEDFSFDDIDEVKAIKQYPSEILEYIYDADNINDSRMEYWNMHTYINKKIEPNKISLLAMKQNFSANDIIKYLASQNKNFVENSCPLLSEYLKIMQ